MSQYSVLLSGSCLGLSQMWTVILSSPKWLCVEECSVRATGHQSRTTAHTHGCSVVTSDYCLEEAAHTVTPRAPGSFP